MTPKQVALVQDSFAKIALTSEAAAELFYDRLFDIAPQMKGNVSRQYDRAAPQADGNAGWGGERSWQSRTGLAGRRRTGKAACQLRCEGGALFGVGAALLWTLQKGLGDGWTPEVADAWGTAYGTLSGYMISEAYGRSQVPSKDIP
jgi:hemoglobin-like flavoprotein